MNTLFPTYNYDIDLEYLLLLNLNDLNNACATNKYTSNLCKNSIILKKKFKKINNKINKIINQVNQREFGIILQPNIEGQQFKSFLDIMFQYDMFQFDNEYEKVKIFDSDPRFNSIPVNYIIIIDDYIAQSYEIQYNIPDDEDEDDNNMNISMYFKDIDTLKKVLLHLYYDNLIIYF
jgi:hypothetical protein